MSAPENQAPEPSPFDPTSSFEVWTNAKGGYQWKLKVRAQSNVEADVRAAHKLAVEIGDKMATKYGGAS